MNRQRSKDVYTSENTLYETVMMNTFHYTFVQTRRIYKTRREL